MAFKVIETQEEFDAAIQKRLEQKDREVAERYKEYTSPDDLKAIKDSYEKKLQAAADKAAADAQKIADHDKVVADLTHRAAAAEGRLLKSQIANAHGIPLELSDRLVGDDADALNKDAEMLAQFMGPKAAPPMRSTEPGAKTGAAATTDAALMQVMGQLFQG